MARIRYGWQLSARRRTSLLHLAAQRLLRHLERPNPLHLLLVVRNGQLRTLFSHLDRRLWLVPSRCLPTARLAGYGD